MDFHIRTVVQVHKFHLFLFDNSFVSHLLHDLGSFFAARPTGNNNSLWVVASEPANKLAQRLRAYHCPAFWRSFLHPVRYNHNSICSLNLISKLQESKSLPDSFAFISILCDCHNTAIISSPS